MPAHNPIMICSDTPVLMNRSGNSSRNFCMEPAGEMSATTMATRLSFLPAS